MPIHDWTRVEAGIYHSFHVLWLAELTGVLNEGLLPEDYFALAEQVAGGLGPDVLTLQSGANGNGSHTGSRGGLALASAAPKVRFRVQTEEVILLPRTRAVSVRHVSDNKVVAMIELISPGNKSNDYSIQTFLTKTVGFLREGVHMSIVDLFPPTPRDPEGLHSLIWRKLTGEGFAQPEGQPLTLVSYRADARTEAFLQPAAVGDGLTPIPLFLNTEQYVELPLEETYQAAWRKSPAHYRHILEGPGN